MVWPPDREAASLSSHGWRGASLDMGLSLKKAGKKLAKKILPSKNKIVLPIPINVKKSKKEMILDKVSQSWDHVRSQITGKQDRTKIFYTSATVLVILLGLSPLPGWLMSLELAGRPPSKLGMEPPNPIWKESPESSDSNISIEKTVDSNKFSEENTNGYKTTDDGQIPKTNVKGSEENVKPAVEIVIEDKVAIDAEAFSADSETGTAEFPAFEVAAGETAATPAAESATEEAHNTESAAFEAVNGEAAVQDVVEDMVAFNAEIISADSETVNAEAPATEAAVVDVANATAEKTNESEERDVKACDMKVEEC